MSRYVLTADPGPRGETHVLDSERFKAMSATASVRSIMKAYNGLTYYGARFQVSGAFQLDRIWVCNVHMCVRGRDSG